MNVVNERPVSQSSIMIALQEHTRNQANPLELTTGAGSQTTFIHGLNVD